MMADTAATTYVQDRLAHYPRMCGLGSAEVAYLDTRHCAERMSPSLQSGE